VSGYKERVWIISLQTSMRKIISLAFIYVNLHLAYSIEWRIYASFRTLCIWTYDAYMSQSAQKEF